MADAENETGPSTAKAKGKRVRKGRQSDGRASSDSSSESELDEQVRQGNKKPKIRINFYRATADERKKCQKGSGGGESEHEYDDRVSLHADDDSELAGNLNNFLGTNKESEDEDSDCGLKSLIQGLDENEEIGEKSIKIMQILQIKFGKTLMFLRNSKPK